MGLSWFIIRLNRGGWLLGALNLFCVSKNRSKILTGEEIEFVYERFLVYRDI